MRGLGIAILLLSALAVVGAESPQQRTLCIKAGSVLAVAVHLGGIRGGKAAVSIDAIRSMNGVGRLRGGRSENRERKHKKDKVTEVEADGSGVRMAAQASREEQQFQEQLEELHKEAVGLLGKQQREEEEPVVDEIQEEDLDTEERFSYFKQAEKEVRAAEKAEEERNRIHEEYMERRRRGELPPITEEARDTLRWGDDSRAREDERRSGGERGERSYNHAEFALPDDDMPVEEWLEQQGLGQYSNLFLDEGWDTMRAVLSMSQDDLVELGVKKGHIRRMMLALGHQAASSRSSMAPYDREGNREASYARGRPEPSVGRRRRRPHPDDDIDVKPYAIDNPHEILMEQAEARDRMYRGQGEPVHTSVRTRFGPGGRSNIADSGGLGAFMTGVGGAERDDGREDSVESYMPRHRRIQHQKDEIVDRLERGRRASSQYDRRR